MYLDIKVLGGLPVCVYVEDGYDWHIVSVAGRRVKKFAHVQWLYNRIEANDREFNRILRAIEETRFAA